MKNISNISNTSNTSNVSNIQRNYKDYTAKQKEDEYNRILKEMKEIFDLKRPMTDEDAAKMGKLLKELQELKEAGVNPEMNQSIELIMFMFEAGGIDLSNNNFQFNAGQLYNVSQIKIEKYGKAMDISSILKLDLATVTRTLQDMMLVFSKSSYNNFSKKIKDLKDQVDLSADILALIEQLERILKDVKVKLPEGYAIPPTSINDIPQLVQAMIPANSDGTVKSPEQMIAWCTENKEAFIDYSEKYFKGELGVIPNNTIENAISLLKMRDQLFDKIEALKAAGAATGEGSPIDALEKALSSITEKGFTFDYYPKGQYENLPDGTTHRLELWMKSGQYDSAPTSDILTNAANANKRLSSTAQNEFRIDVNKLEQIFQVLDNVQKDLKNSLRAFTQKM